MASKDPDECFNTETDEETVALRKKRLRRVSFADREITSVHIFNRDDDYETPPDSSSRKPSSAGEENEVLGFFRDLAADSDESREMSPDDDDEIVSRNSFLRPIGSPSPGSGTIGSATSNDEDNFFGPVSAGFIRPRRLSDSAASDDNHDVTMDSTAFSMHFRSLVRSESGDLKTPTGFRSAFEEKTPTQVVPPSDGGNFMVLTKARKPIAQTPSAVDEVSCGRDSNDMSLVGENPHRYDYGRLPAELEALLAESSKKTHDSSLFDSASKPKSSKSEVPKFNDSGIGMNVKDNKDSDMCNVYPDDVYTEGLPMVHSILSEVNGGSMTDINQITHDCPSNTNDGLVADAYADHDFQTPNQPNKVNKAFIEAETGISMLNVEFPVGSSDNSQHEPADLSSTEKLLKENLPTDGTCNSIIDQLPGQQPGSPLSGSITSLSVKRKQIFVETTNSSRHLSYVTPSPKQPGSFLRKEDIKVGDSMQSIQKSHYKSKNIGSSSHTYALRDGIDKSKHSLGVSGSDMSSVEITLDHKKDQKAASGSYEFVSPPTKSLDQMLSSPAECQAILSGNSKQQDQRKNLVIDSGLDGNSVEYVTSGDHLTDMSNKLESFSDDQRTQSSSPLLKVDHVKDFTQVKSADDTEIYSSTLQKASEIIKNFQKFSRDIDSMKFQLSSPKKNLQIANDPFLTKEELPREGIKASTCVYASPYVHRIINKPSLWKSPTRKEPTWSPSVKEQGDSALRDLAHLFVSKDGLSSKSSSDEHCNDGDHQKLDNSQSPFLHQDFDNSCRGKRRSEEIIPEDVDNASNINWIQRSPKVHKSGGTDLDVLLEQSNGRKRGHERIGGDRTFKQWTGLFLQFIAEINQILSPLIEKLNTRAIGELEENLVCLQKVNKYEMLCSEIQSQKIYDQSHYIKHKRVAETRLLLHKIMFEKAKLQIMHMNHENLLKRGQLLKSGIQKFQILKLNCVRHLGAPVRRDTRVDENLYNSSLINSGSNHEVAGDNVTTMREEAESLGRKTKNLVKSFHTYCKMKGVLSCEETIALLNDHLKKRMRCRSIRQDLQLWDIDNLETSNANQSLVLNYCGFICQRFTKTSHPVSSMVISNKINDITIKKHFPNMDSCVAFAFLFNAESTKKHVGLKSLAQETQTTSSLLHNLLAVVEEVQLARIENRNLMQTSFNSPSAEQLNLQLSFIDFNGGRKVSMTLDMTCLNCGVYPSEILPYGLEVSTATMQKSQPESLSSTIKAAVANLTIGYSRIVRLCSCVSQLVELSSR